MRHHFLALIALMGVTFAQEASASSIIIRNVNLRAGPDTAYPMVARLRRDTAVDVYGCTQGWYWCDVASGPYRGWVSGQYLYSWYDNRSIAIVEAAPVMHVPVVNFDITYWDKYYRNRPFYKQRAHWDRGHHYGRDRDDWDDHDDHDRGRGRGHDWH